MGVNVRVKGERGKLERPGQCDRKVGEDKSNDVGRGVGNVYDERDRLCAKVTYRREVGGPVSVHREGVSPTGTGGVGRV